MKQLYDQNRRISIHASAREATQNIADTNADPQFQSTLPRGKRPACRSQRRQRSSISIHASAREATWTVDSIDANFKISIHASAREATFHVKLVRILHRFQSTLPRGKRQKLSIQVRIQFLFQSTLPRGKRLQSHPQDCSRHSISIHASAREATLTA